MGLPNEMELANLIKWDDSFKRLIENQRKRLKDACLTEGKTDLQIACDDYIRVEIYKDLATIFGYQAKIKELKKDFDLETYTLLEEILSDCY